MGGGSNNETINSALRAYGTYISFKTIIKTLIKYYNSCLDSRVDWERTCYKATCKASLRQRRWVVGLVFEGKILGLAVRTTSSGKNRVEIWFSKEKIKFKEVKATEKAIERYEDKNKHID